MKMSDYYDDPLWEDREPGYSETRTHVCRHCGAQNLLWEENTDGTWVQHDTKGRVHKCDEKAVMELSTWDFTDIS